MLPDRDSIPEAAALFDMACEVVRRVFGPDEEPIELRIFKRAQRLVVTTDHGAQMTFESAPSVN